MVFLVTLGDGDISIIYDEDFGEIPKNSCKKSIPKN